MVLLTNITESLNGWLETPKKNVKYLKSGKEEQEYRKYRHNVQLADAALLTLFWIIGITKHLWGGYINVFIIIAAGYILSALPYSYRQHTVRHHHI